LKASIGALLAITMMAVSGAHAQTDRTTVKDLLAACASDDQDTKTKMCDKPFGSFLYFTVEAYTNMGYKPAGTPRLCIPLTEDAPADAVRFEKALLPWLKVHPELQSKPEFDGMMAATLAVYGCEK
jgi:hypothetical protein